MLRYLDAFADYNPLEDELPKALYFQIGYVEQQALELLPRIFTMQELNAGLETLFKLDRSGGPLLIVKQLQRREGNSKYTGRFSSPPYETYLATEQSERQVLPDGAPFEWSWLFAIAALASLADYVALHKKAQRKSLSAFEAEHKEEQILEAIEDLGFARLYRDRETRHIKRGKRISKTKLANYQPLKNAVFAKFYELENQPKMSVRKAAKSIYAALPEHLQLAFKSDDPIQQIAIWIGQYKKGTLPGQAYLPRKPE